MSPEERDFPIRGRGKNLCGSLVSLPSVTSVSIPFSPFLLSAREAAGRRMYTRITEKRNK